MTATTRRHRPRRPRSTGSPEVDATLYQLIDTIDAPDKELAFEMLANVIRVAREPISRLDRKVINVALKEMRYAFGVFGRYRDRRKVTVFGSARTDIGDADYQVAVEFGRLMAQQQWMVVTGAGPGIMRAANEGAGQEASFGVNIVLPFENQPNEFIAGDPKLMNFKYFFTRKLMFIKEADAFVLFPGGYGTMDELFELVTLVQTGKSDIHPIVMLEAPGGTYWEGFTRHVERDLLGPGYINAEDLGLFYVAPGPLEAVRHIQEFYRVYHSQRYVGGRLVLRLAAMPAEAELVRLSREFKDILGGPIRRTGPSAAEVQDDDVPALPRVSLEFDRVHYGRLRSLIDGINGARLEETPNL